MNRPIAWGQISAKTYFETQPNEKNTNAITIPGSNPKIILDVQRRYLDVIPAEGGFNRRPAVPTDG